MNRDMAYWLQQTLNVIQLASFYMPLAVAFALVQGITRRVFLSFGDLAMFASFAAIYACFNALLRGEGDFVAAATAFAMAVACTGALGVVIARGVFGTSLIANAQAFMIASLGLSIALQETMRLQSQSRDVWVPPLFQGMNLWSVGGEFPVRLTFMTGLSIMISICTLIIFLVVMKQTQLGRHWRACAQSIHLAKLCGVNTEKIIAATFMLSAALAAISGWISAISYGGTNFSIGLMMGFKAMFASVVGGFGSLRGAIVGACVLAVVEVLWSATFSSTYRDVAVFAIIIGILLLKPEGLAGSSIRRESEVI